MAESFGVFITTIITYAVAALAQESLTNGLLLADPTNCSAYYEFVPQLKYCPMGLVFNSKRQTCDLPTRVDCSCNGSSEGGINNGNDGGDDGQSSGSEGNPGEDNNNVDTGESGIQGMDCPTRGKCPAVDPLDQTVHLPHMNDCNLFCRCDHGVPKLDRCPAGLHFNPRLQVCDSPQSAECAGGEAICQPLSNNNRSHWEPDSCAKDRKKIGETCHLVCKSDYQLSGSANITCTEEGWSGAMGVDQIPSCKTINETGEDLMNNIHGTLGRQNNLLFILDESGSVGPRNFDIELNFVKAIIGAFPLSKERSAGVITFSSRAAVDISIKESDTCNFLSELTKIRYSSGGTDILRALNLAYYEVTQNAIHNLTLIFLVTDGISTTDPTSAADKIKARGDVLFTVGVAGYNETQLVPLSSVDKKGTPLFYGIKNFKVFNAVASYLSTKYNNGTSIKC